MKTFEEMSLVVDQLIDTSASLSTTRHGSCQQALRHNQKAKLFVRCNYGRHVPEVGAVFDTINQVADEVN
jgi:hypothetical protein